MDAENIEQIPCPLCKSMIRSRQSFVKQYMELCEHCKTKFALKFCICKKNAPGDHREKFPTSHHEERYAPRGRREVDWIKLSPEKKLIEKDEIFYKNMYDFFRHFPPSAQTGPKYKIRPLLDDRLYGNVEDFFRNIGPSLSYDSVSPARYDDRAMSESYKYYAPLSDDEPYLSGQYKYYGTNRRMDDQRWITDRYSLRGAGPTMDDEHYMPERPKYYGGRGTEDRHPMAERYYSEPGQVVEDDNRVFETHEKHRKYYSGPIMDDHHRVVETHERFQKQFRDDGPTDDHRQVLETRERYHEHIRGEPVDGQRVSEIRERHHKYYSGPVIDDHDRMAQRSVEQSKYYRGKLLDDRGTISERHSEYSGPMMDRSGRVIETHETHHKYYRGPVMDDPHRMVQRSVGQSKYYHRGKLLDDRGSISERHSDYSGPVMDRPGRVIESRERYHTRYYGAPVMDDFRSDSERHERLGSHHKRYGGSEMDDHRPIAAKGYARQYKLYSGPDIDDRRSAAERRERHTKHYRDGPVMDDHYAKAERPERHKYSSGGGPMIDGRHQTSGRHNRRYDGRSIDDHSPIAVKGFAKPYKLFGTGPLGARTAPDLNEEHRGRRADRARRGYASEPDTTASSSRASGRGSGKKKGKKGQDDLLMIHERGTFKYVEKSAEVEKFKEYMEQVKEQQKQEQKDKLWDVKETPALKSKIRAKIKSDRESHKRESLKGKKEKSDQRSVSENKKDMGRDGALQEDKKKDKSAKDTDEAVLKALESNEGIVPIKEAALHIDELDKRTSINQARKIEERLQEVALKRRKPIIVEFIKRKKKSPRVRQGARARFSRLNSLKSLTERRKKENIKPEKISEIDAFNVSSCQELESIIIGPKIYQYRAPLKDSGEPNLHEPLLYKSMPVVKSKLEVMPIPDPKSRKGKNLPSEEPAKIAAPTVPAEWDQVANTIDELNTDGIISYALSDRRFIEKGWSKLPTEHIVRRMNVYRMRPTHPDFDWFERNKCNERMQFESGERFAEFDNEAGRCQIYYKNGKIALDHYRSEEPLTEKRIVIYSKDDQCSVNMPQSILAIFDHLGNGVVFDHKGKIRLKFNQTEGIILDKSLGPNCHWEWHSLNDPPQLKHIMVDTNLIYKDQDIFKEDDHDNVPKRQVDEAVHAIELDNIVKEKKKKMTLPYKRFPIKIKSVKINDQFTLLIIDQATIYLKFKEGSTFFKTNIGLILDQNEIVDTVTEKLGAVMNSVERRPAPTESLAALQQTVLRAQRDDKRLTLRERRINRPADHCDNLDRMMTLISKPLRKDASLLKPFVCDCALLCTCVNN